MFKAFVGRHLTTDTAELIYKMMMILPILNSTIKQPLQPRSQTNLPPWNDKLLEKLEDQSQAV